MLQKRARGVLGRVFGLAAHPSTCCSAIRQALQMARQSLVYYSHRAALAVLGKELCYFEIRCVIGKTATSPLVKAVLCRRPALYPQ